MNTLVYKVNVNYAKWRFWKTDTFPLRYLEKAVKLPQQWNELSRKQLLKICKVMARNWESDKALLQVFKILSGWHWYKVLRTKPDELLPLLDYCKWVYEKNECIDNILLQYKGYYMPDSKFNNFLISEFHFADEAYKKWSENNDVAALNELCAIICRKPLSDYNIKTNVDGDVRRPFKPGEVAYNTRIVAAWPMYVKLAILLYFDACREWLYLQFDEVFSGSGDDDLNLGVYGLIRGIAGQKFGDFEKVEKLPVVQCFMELLLIKRENDRIEAEIKKNS